MQVTPRRPAYLTRLAVGGPLMVAALLLVVVVRADLVSRFATTSSEGALAFERVTLEPGVIRVRLRNDGSAPVTIAQVSVNDAFWRFTTGRRTLGRLGTTTVTVHYPWEVDRPLHLAVLTSSGASAEHDVSSAALTPALGGRTLGDYAWLGVILGVLPVGLGLLLLPALRRLPPGWVRFVLALSIGLLAFVVVETLNEGLDQAHQAPVALRGVELFVVGLMVVTAVMAWLGRVSRRAPAGLGLAYLVALGIGLHNLGGGLAVGAAMAIGETALGTAILVGLGAHNTTQGVAIASSPGAPAAPPPLRHLVALTIVAGGPAVLGAWAGAHVATPAAAALAFGAATGTIAWAIWAVGRTLVGQERGSPTPVAGGFVVGVVAMYVVALLTA